MFITTKNFRSDKFNSLIKPDEQQWRAVELALNKPWFLATICENLSTDEEEAMLCRRTVLFTNVADVEQLAQQRDGLLQVEDVYIVTPERLNGSEKWKMEPLASVWVAEETQAPGQLVEIAETKAGLKYVITLSSTPIDELKNLTLRCRF
jgi:hypothetical protein